MQIDLAIRTGVESAEPKASQCFAVDQLSEGQEHLGRVHHIQKIERPIQMEVDSLVRGNLSVAPRLSYMNEELFDVEQGDNVFEALRDQSQLEHIIQIQVLEY